MLTNDDLLIAEAAARNYPRYNADCWTVTNTHVHPIEVVDGLKTGALSFDEC